MAERTNVPEIRFAGFTDPWEQRKLGDCFDFLQNNTLSRADLNLESGSARNIHYGDILIKFGDCFGLGSDKLPFVDDESILSKYVNSTLRVGDIIFADTAEDESAGKCVELVELPNEPVISGLHTIPVRPKFPFGSGYLGHYLNAPAYHDQLLPLMQGVKVISVSKTTLQDTQICFPTVSEQSAIGASLNALDFLITLHQRKHDKLVQLKKSMLDKMFPKPGETEPEIRFAGFTDPWEQRKLGEIIQLGGSGGTPSATNPNYYGGEIPFLGIADIEGRDIAHTAKTLTKEGLRNSAAWIVPAGAVSLAMYASVGKVGIIRQDTATSQAFYNMVFEDVAIRDFVFTRLEKADASLEWEPYISTGTQRNLNADKVKAFAIAVPGSREAAKIGRCFANLDFLITLHQRKLELLRNTKKSLLDRMFV